MPETNDRLGKTEIVLIGSVVAFGLIAFWAHQETKRCNESTKKIVLGIEDVKYALQRNEEQVRIGNKKLEEGNDMLRELVKKKYDIAV